MHDFVELISVDVEDEDTLVLTTDPELHLDKKARSKYKKMKNAGVGSLHGHTPADPDTSGDLVANTPDNIEITL